MARCHMAELAIVAVICSLSVIVKEAQGCRGGGGGGGGGGTIFVPGNCVNCEEVNREIANMQNSLRIAEGSSQEVIHEIRKLLSSKNGAELQVVLERVSQELQTLGNIPTDDYMAKFAQLEATFQQVKSINENSQNQMDSMTENLTDKVNDASDAAKKHIHDIQDSLSDMKQELRDYNDMLASKISNMLATNSQLTVKSENLMKATTEVFKGRLSSVSSAQQKEIERMQQITTTRLKHLGDMAEQIKTNVGERQAAEAEKMVAAAKSLNSSIGTSMANISKSLDKIKDEQDSLEMVIKFSRAVNRIDYLFDWWMRLGGEEVVEKADRIDSQNWAKAVLFGEPSDHPIEDILDTLEALIVGSSSNNFLLDKKSINNECLLDIYLSNVRESLQQQQVIVIDTEEAKQKLIESNDLNPMSLLARSVSERFVLGSYVESLRIIEARALFMAMQARDVLRSALLKSKRTTSQPQAIDVPNVRRKRDLAAWGRRKDVHEVNIKSNSNIKFRNVQGVFTKMKTTYEAQVGAYARVLNSSTATIRKEVPLIINRDPTKKQITASGLLLNSTGLLRQLYIEHEFLTPYERRMITGCRFCHASDCLHSGTTAVAMQCGFTLFREIKGERGALTILPNDKRTEEKAANKIATSQPNHERAFKVVTGVNRVKKPDEEFICGVSLKRMDSFSMAFGIGIDVCSRNNGSFLYQQDPVTGRGSNFVLAESVNQFNTLWVLQTSGSTSGIGFYVSADPSKENQTAKNIVNIELESVF